MQLEFVHCLLDSLLAELGTDDRVALRSAGGAGAGSFLLPASEDSPSMPDRHFQLSLQLRLRMPVCAAGATCQHRRQDGSVCGEALDCFGAHALKCGIGASRTARHNRLRDYLAKFIKELSGQAAECEQRVPPWDRWIPCVCAENCDCLLDAARQERGKWELAVLDVATRDPSSGVPLFLDAIVRCCHSSDPARQTARSRRDGVAAEETARDKHVRYPGGGLVAIALESHGRPAEETATYLRGFNKLACEEYPAMGLGAVWQALSTHLQIGNAEMLLSAMG